MGETTTSQTIDLAELKWVAAEASPTERVALRPATILALIASLEKAEAENARLREALRLAEAPTEEMVERGAAEMWRVAHDGMPPPWEKQPPSERLRWQNDARAVLTAALTANPVQGD